MHPELLNLMLKANLATLSQISLFVESESNHALPLGPLRMLQPYGRRLKSLALKNRLSFSFGIEPGPSAANPSICQLEQRYPARCRLGVWYKYLKAREFSIVPVT